MRSRALAFGLLTTLVGSLHAQTVYIDFGTPTSVPPSPAYGAARGVPGHWNKVSASHVVFPLVDIAGQPTAATAYEGLGGSFHAHDFTQLTGDDKALFDTWMESGYGPIELRLNLVPGRYHVLMFGGASADLSHPWGAGTTGFDIYIGTAEGDHQGGFAFDTFQGSYVGLGMGSKVFETLPSGFVEIDIWGGVSGMQLVRLADAAPFCAGHLGDCPCGNVGQPGRGCPSSFDAAGALLTGSGSMLVGNDSLQLVATSVSNSVVTIFQGSLTANNGRGVPFGDGLRCAGGSIVRLTSKLATGGMVTYPEAGEQPIALRGGVPAAGGFRTYQVWYRNAASWCTAATFNLTNGIAVQWLP